MFLFLSLWHLVCYSINSASTKLLVPTSTKQNNHVARGYILLFTAQVHLRIFFETIYYRGKR